MGYQLPRGTSWQSGGLYIGNRCIIALCCETDSVTRIRVGPFMTGYSKNWSPVIMLIGLPSVSGLLKADDIRDAHVRKMCQLHAAAVTE